MRGVSHHSNKLIFYQNKQFNKQKSQSTGAVLAQTPFRSVRISILRAAISGSLSDIGRRGVQCSKPESSSAMRIWAVSDVHADYKENMEWYVLAHEPISTMCIS